MIFLLFNLTNLSAKMRESDRIISWINVKFTHDIYKTLFKSKTYGQYGQKDPLEIGIRWPFDVIYTEHCSHHSTKFIP